MEIKKIGEIRTLFKTKFGLPRQSGISDNIKARMVFENEYRSEEAIRGLEEFSHVWVIWGFSECDNTKFSPTVRPPRLGGNKRMGVFATRSPFRPNGLALSCLKLEGIEKDKNDGYVLLLAGADMMDRSPVYDIKPYIPYTDSKQEAKGGFSERIEEYQLNVTIPKSEEEKLTKEELLCLRDALREDPRPSYIEESNREYGFPFSSYEVKFKVDKRELEVTSIEKINK